MINKKNWLSYKSIETYTFLTPILKNVRKISKTFIKLALLENLVRLFSFDFFLSFSVQFLTCKILEITDGPFTAGIVRISISQILKNLEHSTKIIQLYKKKTENPQKQQKLANLFTAINKKQKKKMTSNHLENQKKNCKISQKRYRKTWI